MSNVFVHVVSISTGTVFGFAQLPAQTIGKNGRLRQRVTAKRAVTAERAARPNISWGPKDGKLNFYSADLPYTAYGGRIRFEKCTCCTCIDREADCKCMCTYKLGR